MPHASCAHCGTEIADHTSMVEKRGELYCCGNCAEVATSEASRTGAETCAHCGTPILDASTSVTQGETYCCNNCAIAVGATTASTP